MISITDKTQCNGCGACEQICTHQAIKMSYDEYGQLYPSVDPLHCVNCGLCDRVCIMHRKEELPEDSNLETLVVKAAYNCDEDVRFRSTSGGFFSLVAEYVINQGGVVCAARFDEHYHIKHAFFDSIDDIDLYRGSKYAQSELADSFKKIRNYLKIRPVLFVGTPCQVAGLKFFLMKDYENLYTCDFICMCISSGKMWNEYIDEYQKQHIIKRIFFKDKRFGWHMNDWRMLIEDETGEHLCKWNSNEYFNAYIKHLSARPSCFSCAVRHCKHLSDITFSDAWGIEVTHPDFDDNKGCTTLILQSDKGKKMFDAVKVGLQIKDWDIESVKAYNRHINTQPYKPEQYDKFCYEYEKHGFEIASNYMIVDKRNFFQRINNKFKKIVR